jgi:hypothetical protein
MNNPCIHESLFSMVKSRCNNYENDIKWTSHTITSAADLALGNSRIPPTDELDERDDKPIFRENPTNAKDNEMTIVLLNFCDETTRPVFCIGETRIDKIKSLYEMAELEIDVEPTTTCIHKDMVEDLSGVLFRDILYSEKYTYLNEYIPSIIENEKILKKIEKLKKQCFVNVKPSSSDSSKPDSSKADVGLSPFNVVSAYTYSLNQMPPNLAIKCTPNLKCMFSNYETVLKGVNLPDNMKKTQSSKVEEKRPYCSEYLIEKPSSSQNVVSYNEEYNVLCPTFGSNCMKLSPYYDVELEPKPKTPTRVTSRVITLIHIKYLKSIVIINPDIEIVDIVSNHAEYGFYLLFDIQVANEIAEFIHTRIHMMLFNDVSEINAELSIISHYVEYISTNEKNTQQFIDEEADIRIIFNKKYAVNDDISQKMKASTLADTLFKLLIEKRYTQSCGLNEENPIILPVSDIMQYGDTNKTAHPSNNDIISFRTRLSKYLKDLGLKKKRFNDGIYYYGIQLKEPVYNQSKINLNQGYDALRDECHKSKQMNIF